ncbi:MAG: UDP-N-acetylmuramoyl-L-alanine--D-glutamate ligase [Gammaproteobacteria bacterium]|nr:UDP-N-acetylmuramoyl-L-alanine--D-glutamate ligase [Gammaproteobacteria bacterium]
MNALNIMVTKPEQAVYTLVVGLGKTGLSAVRYLRAIGEPVIVVDSRDVPPGLSVLKNEYRDVELHTGAFDVSLFTGAHRIIVSPGVAMVEPALVAARKNNIEIIGDIDLFSHEVNAPVIGITGSNGKSTVTTLLALMASQAGLKSVASGNIGIPVLDSLDSEVALYVLELSSFQLETLQHLPMKAAVVLNISADHLDRYESMASYAMSKQAIYQNAEIMVLNKDDEVASQVNGLSGKQIRFTLAEPGEGEFGLCQDESAISSLCFGRQKLVAVADLQLKGKHNMQNALAALALGYAAGLPFDAMITALKEFRGLPHRTQLVARIDDVNWINDSKATNVGAAIAAMLGLPGKHVLIAGGMGKGADFSDLTAVVKQHCRAVILMGEDADRIQSVMPESVIVKQVADMQSAVLAAKELALPGDNVLLAPACASFDMFDNFEHRGDVFLQSVQVLRS